MGTQKTPSQLVIIIVTNFYTTTYKMYDHLNTLTYLDLGELAFGKKRRLLVLVFMYTKHYLIATGFLILKGDNLHDMSMFGSCFFEIVYENNFQKYKEHHFSVL